MLVRILSDVEDRGVVGDHPPHSSAQRGTQWHPEQQTDAGQHGGLGDHGEPGLPGGQPERA
jgi:hypothetical protein